jgi:O-antigen/teichoic acid export membrane protein
MRLENYEKVADIYKKSALTQLIVGVYLLVGVWSCIDFVYQIMPNGNQFVSGKYVVLILGLVKLVDMATGVNSEIISYSKYYMFNLYALIILAVLNIGSNLYLIPRYGVIGAASATLISMVIFNIVKLIYIYLKIHVQPFQKEMLYVLVFGLLASFIAAIVPNTPSIYFNILMKGGIVSLIFGFLIIKYKISPDVNGLFNKLLNNYK